MAPPLDDAARAEPRLLLREAVSTRPAREPTPQSAPPAPPHGARRSSLLDQISGRLVAVLSVGWVALLVVLDIQPDAPGNPVMPAWAVALAVVHVLALLAMIVGFAIRQRWSLLASATSASAVAVSAIACPLTSHHETVGLAWGASVATSAALAAASATAFARHRS